jgi:hypothetical protein
MYPDAKPHGLRAGTTSNLGRGNLAGTFLSHLHVSRVYLFSAPFATFAARSRHLGTSDLEIACNAAQPQRLLRYVKHLSPSAMAVSPLLLQSLHLLVQVLRSWHSCSRGRLLPCNPCPPSSSSLTTLILEKKSASAINWR